MAFPTTPIRDDFNRGAIGANWTTPILDANALTRPNGATLPGQAGVFSDGVCNPFTISPGTPLEVFVKTTGLNTGANAETCMPYALIASALSGYGIEFDDDRAVIQKITLGVQAALKIVTYTAVAGDVVGMCVRYGVIECWVNGVMIDSVANTVFTALTRIGLEAGNATAVLLDDFGGGPVPVPLNCDYSQFPKQSFVGAYA